jgi:hypothetical protein
MCGGVIEHHMHLEVLGHRRVDQVQEAPELLGAMPGSHVRDHLAGAEVEGGVEVGGAVADVVVGAALGHTRHQRQDRRRAVKGLDLGLLIDAQHHRSIRRVQIQAHDVAHLLDELRIGRQLERLGLVRFQAKGAPDTAHRRLAHPGRGRHRSRRPVRSVRRRLLQRLDDHPLDLLIADRARFARTRLIVQPIQPLASESPAPLADRVFAAAQPRRDLDTRLTLSRRQHDPATQRERLRARRTPSPTLQHLPLLISQHHVRKRRHLGLQSSLITTTKFDTTHTVPTN